MRMYLVSQRPFADLSDLRLAFFNEFLVLLYVSTYFILTDTADTPLQDLAGLILVGIIATSTAVNFAYIVWQIGKQMRLSLMPKI